MSGCGAAAGGGVVALVGITEARSRGLLPAVGGPCVFDCVVQRNGQTTNSGHLFIETSW